MMDSNTLSWVLQAVDAQIIRHEWTSLRRQVVEVFDGQSEIRIYDEEDTLTLHQFPLKAWIHIAEGFSINYYVELNTESGRIEFIMY